MKVPVPETPTAIRLLELKKRFAHLHSEMFAYLEGYLEAKGYLPKFDEEREFVERVEGEYATGTITVKFRGNAEILFTKFRRFTDFEGKENWKGYLALLVKYLKLRGAL